MGAHGRRRPTDGGCGLLTDLVALIVPAVPSFSVDAGFRYSVPDALRGSIRPGSLVRIPLGGRRVRGYVLEVGEGDAGSLRPVAAVSGDLAVFGGALLETLRWAAHHYVSPLSTLLERAAPPNNPRSVGPASVPAPGDEGPILGTVLDAAIAGRRIRPTALLARQPPVDLIAGTAARLLHHGKSTVVLVATRSEAETLFGRLSAVAPGHTVGAHGDTPDREATAAWGRAATAPSVLVGTPRVAAWPLADVGAAFILEEGRRAMKERQTPTIHTRDLLRRRSQHERFPLVVVGPTPTTEILAAGPDVVRVDQGRLWPLVEVVDRRDESAGGGIVTEPAKRALAAVARRGGRSFVFGHRRGFAAATRCISCRTVRRCASCGSRPDPGETCTRCGAALGPCTECGGRRFEPLGAGVGRLVAEVGRIVGSDACRPAPADAPVVVGTERDILGLADLDLVLIPDLDGLLHGTNYRAAEDALRLGARLAGIVRRGSSGRMMVQTSEPDHPVVRALVRADPLPALAAELAVRTELGYPPAGELVVIETSGDHLPSLEGVAGSCDVLGPARHGDSTRWLLQAPDLGRTRTLLRPLVQRWRDSGLRVRVDVDPIDL